MGSVQQAVLEFDEEVQAPWRPRLVSVPAGPDGPAARPPLTAPSRRSPSRVGACRPSSGPEPQVASLRAASSRRASPRSATAGVRGPVDAPLRLTRRARRLAVVLGLAGAVALGSWLSPFVGGGDDLSLAGGSSVVVQPGDTLWTIAESLDEDGDVRALVDEIQRLNGLGAAVLVPGQVLQLP
jgi:nucleoid-associated protein YgaU